MQNRRITFPSVEPSSYCTTTNTFTMQKLEQRLEELFNSNEKERNTLLRGMAEELIEEKRESFIEILQSTLARFPSEFSPYDVHLGPIRPDGEEEIRVISCKLKQLPPAEPYVLCMVSLQEGR